MMCVIENPWDAVKLVGEVVKTVVAVQKVRNAKAESEYSAEVMEYEAKKAETKATEERQTGIEDARKQRLNAILNIADEKSGIAASNLSVNSQTSLNIFDDEKLNSEIDAMTTLKNANKRSDAYLDTSESYYRDAELTSFKAKRNYLLGMFDIAGSRTSQLADYMNKKKEGKTK